MARGPIPRSAYALPLLPWKVRGKDPPLKQPCRRLESLKKKKKSKQQNHEHTIYNCKTQKPSPLLPVWVWKVIRHQPQQAIPSPKRKASDRELWSSKWTGHKKLTMPFYIRRRTAWWSLHSKAIGKGKCLTTEAKVGQREGEGPSHCLPQALSGTVNKSWRSLVKSE